MTVRAPGTTARTSARRSAERDKSAISAAYPRSSHSRKNASSGKCSAGAIPHRSNPSSRAFALIDAEVSNSKTKHDDHEGYAGHENPLLVFGSFATIVSFVLALADELPDDVRQDAAVAERHQFLRRIDTRRGRELTHRSIRCRRDHCDIAAGLQRIRGADQVEHFGAGQTERGRVLARFELQRKHAHVHEVAAMDALERLGNDSLDAQQLGALGRPV